MSGLTQRGLLKGFATEADIKKKKRRDFSENDKIESRIFNNEKTKRKSRKK